MRPRSRVIQIIMTEPYDFVCLCEDGSIWEMTDTSAGIAWKLMAEMDEGKYCV